MKPRLRTLLCWWGGIVVLAQPLSAATTTRVLVFSKTTMFRHDSIPNGIDAVKRLGGENNFAVDATEDGAVFTSDNLERYKAVIFLSTSGDILDDRQQDAFRRYLENSGGLVAVHAAIAGDVATEGNWLWFGELCCTRFTNHSSVTQGAIVVEDPKHLSTAHLPKRWVRTDEWYNFTKSPRGETHVLAALDETSYTGGSMPSDHPIAWCHRVGGGRFWYTALGHTKSSYSEPEFLKHLLGGILFAAGIENTAPPSDAQKRAQR